MSDLISSFEHAVTTSLQNTVSTVEAAASPAANEVAQAVGHSFTSVTRGSFLGTDGKLHGPLADAFGSDPVTFAINGVKSQFAKCVDIANRCVARLGLTTVDAKDSRGVKHTIVLRVTSKSSVVEVIAALCAFSIRFPAVIGDELNRLVLGFPVGKGANGFIKPKARGTGAEIPVILAVIGLLVVIAPIILPPILSLLKDGGKSISDALKPPPPPDNSGGLFGVSFPVLAAVGAGIVLLFVLKKKPGASAPGAAPAPGAA